MFSGLWTLVVIGSKLQLYDLFKPNDYVFLIYSLGIASFGIGCLLVSGLKVGTLIKPDNQISQYMINDRVYYLFTIITCIIVWSAAAPTIKLLMEGANFYEIRYIMIGQIQESQNNLLLSYFALPFTHVMMHISVIYMLVHKNKKYLFITLFTILGVVLTNGARLFLLYYLIDVAITKIILKTLYEDNKKNKKKKDSNIYVTLITLFIVIGMVYITLLRKSDIFRTIYMYTVGTVPHMSQRIEQFNVIGQHTYGLTSLQGYLDPSFLYLKDWELIVHYFNYLIYISNNGNL